MGICCRTSASLFRSAKTGACMMNNLQLLTNQWDFFCKLKTNKSSATLALSGCYWPGIDLGVNPKKAQGGRAPELVLRTSSKMTARIEDRTQWNLSKRPAAACGLGCGDTRNLDHSRAGLTYVWVQDHFLSASFGQDLSPEGDEE